MRHVESRKDVGLALEPFPADQGSGRQRWKPKLDGLGAEDDQLRRTCIRNKRSAL